MLDSNKEHLSTTQAARLLGLSVSTVQGLVAKGQLQAVFTHGGHRRIFSTAVKEYRQLHGYREQPVGDVICIMHQGSDLDPALVNDRDLEMIQLMTHPLDLLDVKKNIKALFIDARNPWLLYTPIELVNGLQKKYPVYIYNSDRLPEESRFSQFGPTHLIPKPISANFISGFLTGRLRQAEEMARR